MERAGAHSTYRTTGPGSTSRASGSNSESTLSSGSSTASDVASKLVSMTLGRAADNLIELKQCISRWEAEGHSDTEGHWAPHTQQKVEQHLHTFFNLRRVFAEHQGDATEDLPEDLQHLKKSLKANEKFPCKMFKSACRCFSISHSKTKVTDEQVLDVAEGSKSSSSALHGSSPSDSLHSFQTGESWVVMSPIMEEDLVTDSDSTPAPSGQDGHLEPSEVHVDEVVGSASSSSYLTKSVKADTKSLQRMDKKFGKGFKSACQCFSISHPKTKVTDEQGLDVAEGSQSSSSTCDSILHGSSPSASVRSFQAAEPCVVMPPIMEEDLVTNIDSTPAPSGQYGHLEPSEVHVDEVVGSASSSSYLTKSVKADTKSLQRTDKKFGKGFKSACQCFSISHPKTKVTDEQGLDVAEGSQRSSSTCDSTLHGSSPSASVRSFQAAEPCVVMSPIMEEDLGTDIDSTPAPSGQYGHLEPSEVYVDEVVGSASSSSYLTKSVKADKKSPRRMDKKFCKGFKSACQCFSISHPKTKVTDEQGLDVAEGPQSSSSTSDSTLHGSSSTASLRSFQTAESCVVMSPIMEEDLVTDMDSTPAPSGQDGHLEPSEVHVDEFVGSASSSSYLTKSVKADKKSPRRMDKKFCKGFKSACQCFSIRHPKTKVTDEQGLDVAEGPQSSSSTSDSTLHRSSSTASLRSFQTAESCVVMSPIMEEDLVTDIDSTPAPSGQDGHLEPSEVHVDEAVGSASSSSYLTKSVKADKKSPRRMDKKSCKGFKSACQCFSIRHPKTKVTDEQGLDVAEGSQSSSSTFHGSTPSASLRSLQAAEPLVVMPPIMEEDLVTSIDSTPAPSGQDGHLEPSEVHVDEVVGSASSSSYLTKSVKAYKKSPRRMDKKFCKGFKSACQCFSISHPKTKVTDEQGLDVAEGSQSSSSTFHGSSPPAPLRSLQAAEPCVVMSPIMEEDLVKNIDSTPAPSGQDGHLKPSEVHVDEVVGSASSSSLKKSVKADKKSPQKMDQKSCKGFKSACQCFSISHPKTKVTDEQGLDVAEGSQSSSSTFHGSNPSASLRSLEAAEPSVVVPPIMEEDLVTDMDSTPAPSGQDGHLKPSEVHVDEVVGSASSSSYLTKSVKADKKSPRRMDKKFCKGFKSACQCFSISHPKTKVTDEQGLDVAEGSQSSSSKFHGSSPSASLCSLQAAEPSVVMPPIMEEDLVTSTDSTPAPSEQDGHLEPSEVHVDEVVGSASSSSYLTKSVKADKKSPRRMDKKFCKGFKSACQCFSISHPKTKVTDEQGLDVAEGPQSSSSTSDSTLHGSSSTASLRSFQAAESCVVMPPIMEEDLVTDMDSTLAPSGQDGNLEPSEVYVDEVVGSASSSSYLTKSVKADKKSPRRMDKKFCKGFKSACQCFSIRHPKTKVTDEQGLDVAEGSQSSSSTFHGSTPSASLSSLQAAEPSVVMPPIMEEDLVTNIDSTPAPSGQDGHLEPSEVHVDEVVGSASSSSLKKSVKADKKLPQRMDKKSCKGFKSACQCFSISHSKTKVTDEQGLDVAEGPQSSSSTCDSTLHGLSPSASVRSFQAAESWVVMPPIMEEDLVTDIDSTQAPSGQDGHLEPSEVHVDEVVGSASSGSHLKKSVKADKKSPRRMDKKICKGFKSACQCFSVRHLAPSEVEQNVDENVDTASSVLISDSASTLRLSTTVSISASEDIMTDEEAVTDIDAIPGPSMVLSGAGHVDDVVRSASVFSLENSVKANKKSSGRIGKKIIKGFKCAWQFLSISHPKTKVTDEQGLDVADRSESYSTCDSTFHESSPTASLQAAEHCDVMCPVTEEELVMDMDLTPAPSGHDGHLEPPEVHVDEVVGSASSSSYLKKSLKANEKSPRRMDKKFCNGFKSACQCFSMRHVGVEQNVEENLETGSNNLTSGYASPRELCNTSSIRSSEDIWTADKAEQVTGMAEGTTVIAVSLAPGHVYEVFESSSTDTNLPKPGSPSPTYTEMEAPSEPSTNNSSPSPENNRRSPIKDRNQIMYTDSTSRYSAQDRHLEDSQDDQSAVYVIVTGFIDSLTKEQWKEMSRGVYSMDVQKKMSDNFAKGTKVLVKELEAELSASLQRSASQNSSVHTRSSTSSQLCGNEALAWEILAKFTKELDVTDERMRQILNRSGGKALCDAVPAKTRVSMLSRITEDTLSTEEVKSMSETIDQIQRPPETETTGVHKKKSSWWSVCMKKNVDPPPSEGKDNSLGFVELPPLREAWTEVKKNDEAQDKPTRTKQSSPLKRFQCCFSTSRFPPVSLEDQSNGSGRVELPPVREAWPEVQKNDEAQDKPAQTKQASLLKKIQCCFSLECRCGCC
ncbi:uncharacterized protein LOC115597155 isoform X2 [Sparus aurata]|uniref:uncharacterized protein LOC115597155 isoform X2 n=1 Tax=Sparus aurata TaxID=8175 RepID=UPI0011C181EC|nr:uncharacterized protein LOC115597155 isoform X2 [Sparus aurata]